MVSYFFSIIDNLKKTRYLFPYFMYLSGFKILISHTSFMSKGVGELLGNYIDTFLEYDTDNDVGSWRIYMHDRFLLDVNIPLKRHKKAQLENGA